MLSKYTKAVVLMLTMVFLFGCEKKIREETPEEAAVEFFETLYHEKNIKKLYKMSTPRMARVLKSYGSVKSVMRYLLNLQLDEVVIEIDTGSNKGRSGFAKDAKIILTFNGKYNGRTVKEIKTVMLLKQGGDWLVEDIKDVTLM